MPSSNHPKHSAAAITRWLDEVDQIAKDAVHAGEEDAKHIDSKYKTIEYKKYADRLAVHGVDLKGLKVLDWGAQYGHVSLMLKALGAEVTPYVFRASGAMSTAMTLHFPGQWVEGHENEPRLLPFADGEFDMVVSSGVFEHVYEHAGGSFDASLQEIRRVLKQDGYFVLWKLPNATGLSEIKSDLMGRWAHLFRFTRAGIELLLQNYGFSVPVVEYDALLPLQLRATCRKLRLGGLAASIDGLANFWPFKHFCNDYFVVARKIAQPKNI